MKSILILDDDMDILNIMEKWLGHAGYDEIALYKPPELQSILAENNIELILQDEHLQTEPLFKHVQEYQDGVATKDSFNKRIQQAYAPGLAITHLLRQSGYDGLLYIMVAGLDYAPANLKDLYLRFGASNVIEKPFHPKEFAYETLPLILDTNCGNLSAH